MDPSMIQFAQEMMNKMSPEQVAAMQQQAASMDPAQMQQAMNMLNGMTPEQRQNMQQAAAAMPNIPPNAFAAGAANVKSQLSAQQKYQFDASTQLKTEGNRLHGLKKYKEASEKYKRAIENLSSHSAAESVTLRIACQGNLSNCYLQLGQWNDCVGQCNEVLLADSNNRKAFYRRGQAFSAQGKAEEAIRDLRRALEMSPDTEKPVIKEKLEEAEQKLAHASRGVIIEEVEEGEEISQKEEEEADGAIEEVILEEVKQEKDTDAAILLPDFTAPPVTSAAPRRPAATSAQTPAVPAFPGAAAAGIPADQMAMAAEMMKNDPDMVRKAAEMMAGMSDEALAANLAMAGGMPGATPEMARAAAAAMKNMSTDQIKDMAAKAATVAPTAGSAMPAFTPTVAMPQDPAAAAAAASELMRNDPNSLKTAAQMMKNMPPEQLEAMAASMPGAAGMKIDAEQVKMAAKMMETMTPEDLERMTKLAQSMQGMPGMPTAPPTNLGAAQPAVESGGAGNAAPIAPSVAGAAPHFDTGAGGMGGMNMSPEVMNNMRRQMADPAMLRSMQSMLKGMDPEALAGMMKATGMNLTPEQAKQMVDSMGNASEKTLTWIARLVAVINLVLDGYQKAKAWAVSNGAMTIAIIILLIVLLVRWFGWL